MRREDAHRRRSPRAYARLSPLLLALVLVRAEAAEPGTVPITVQAAIFAKVLTYDQTLEGRGEFKILVAYPDDLADQSDAAVRAFRAAGLHVASAKVGAAPTALESVVAVYVLGPPTPLLKEACQKGQVLLISGNPDHATNGTVAVAIGLKADGKPEIVVHLPTVKAHGHRLSSALLSLARVIQ